jgi:hypothetical protein
LSVYVRFESVKIDHVQTCQTIAPAAQPLPFASDKQEASISASMNPFVASAVVCGFPITSFSFGTVAAISKTDDFGQVLED